jgi:hypothetical protein
MIRNTLDLLQITTDGTVVQRKIPDTTVRKDGSVLLTKQWEDELHLNLLRLQDILGDDELEHTCGVLMTTCDVCNGTGYCMEDNNVLSKQDIRSTIVDLDNKRRWSAISEMCHCCEGSGIYLNNKNLVTGEDEENLHW